MKWPPIPQGDLPETRGPGEPWHSGCMVTQERAVRTARVLFPDEVTNGSDCRAEVLREGQPCRICAARNEAWVQRVAQVRRAMLDAFS